MKLIHGIVIGIAIGAVVGTGSMTFAARSRGDNPPRVPNSVVADEQDQMHQATPVNEVPSPTPTPTPLPSPTPEPDTEPGRCS